MLRILALAVATSVAGCGAVFKRSDPAPAPQSESRPEPKADAPARRPGAYYKDDGPGDRPPVDLASIPDAIPRAEPPHRFANRPYQVFGRDYAPIPSAQGFRQKGIASWYGRRYHGQNTSSGEPYDMYGMTAAHPLLPIPSYVRVTSVANRRSVVVRVNDRGPFHADRVIDLSYTAAWKLGYIEAGSALVEIEHVEPGAATAVASAPAAAATPAAAAGGVYLQLGAFSVRESADNFRARIYRELGWLSDPIQVHAATGLYRLQLGPFRSVEEARPIAERIEAELAFKPLLVFR
ncbi:MAG: septal ring lytic transglycosylase RlpA family protein [Betaproteobacteria bacterium]